MGALKPVGRVAADVVSAAHDRMAGDVSDGLLSAEEEGGLTAALPRLASLATELGVMDKPLAAWGREEMLRFLTLAVRAAVPLRSMCGDPFLTPDLNDKIPF